MKRHAGRRVGIAAMILPARWPSLALALAAWWLPWTRAAEPLRVTIDVATTNGLIRPLHGVNLGPLCYRGTVDLTPFHRELAIPLTRLHDVVWLNAEAIDIHTIFRDFRNDAGRPENYDFEASDDYIRAITNTGSRIVYRLGESIEHTGRKYHVHPPRDPAKWADICAQIIRHYNEGWAEGFRHDIRYWEIWNEPDVRPQMWTGSEEQFLELYEVAAKTLKTRFPQLKIGGPALGGTGSFDGEAFKPAAFLARFLSRCRERKIPLDFFSWHRYTSDAWDLPRRAQALRRLLDEHGFRETESHLNEWNYLPGDDWRPLVREGQGPRREQWFSEMGGPRGAAFTAAALILFQDAPLDAANYYTGEIQGFGLFTFHGVPKTSYFAFKAFRQMLDTPIRLATHGAIPRRLAVLAGANPNRSEVRVLISSVASEGAVVVAIRNPPWPEGAEYEIMLVDQSHHLERTQQGRLREGSLELSFSGPSVVLVKLRAGR